MVVTLKRLQHADINLLRELRNANADAFFDSTYITREAQEDWWYRYSRPAQCKIAFYAILLNNVTLVGFISVKRLRWMEVGWLKMIGIKEIGNLLLAPAYRGQGIMHAAITEVRRLYDPLTFWVAHVKPDNKASLKLFERQGFCNLTPSKQAKRRTA